MNMKLLFLVAEDWYFWSHRLSIARAAREAGIEVYVMARINRHADAIRSEGFELIPWSGFVPGGMNPLKEIQAVLQVLRQYRRVRPDLVHHVHNKPILYGGLAARLCGIPAMNTVAGLGLVFAEQSVKMRTLRRLMVNLFRVALNGKNRTLTAFQNGEDLDYFLEMGVVTPSRVTLIRGSGVDLSAFPGRPNPSGIPVVMLAARLLWKKGIREFISAARAVAAQGIPARFVIVGAPDTNSPNAVPESVLRQWHNEGVVEWWGRRSDMAAVLAEAAIVCLPSTYREGVPRVLIEAASCCRPIVTTNIGGCRDIVRDSENGILVPPGDSEALAEAIRRLLADPNLREMMGRRGRQIVAEQFSDEYVVSETSIAYRRLIPDLPSLVSVRSGTYHDASQQHHVYQG